MDRNKILNVLNKIYAASDELTELLLPFEREINRIAKKPLAEMNVSERMHIAVFITKIREDHASSNSNG